MSDLQQPNGDQVPPALRAEEILSPPPEPPAVKRVSGDSRASSAEEQANVAGLIAFVSALLGFCLPLLPTLVAIVFGIIGLLRPQRALAIAALILSFIQLLCLAIAAVAINAAVQNGAVQTIATVAIAQTGLDDALAREASGDAMFAIGASSKFTAADAWGVPFRVEVVEIDGARTIFIWSAGLDQTFGTNDDFVAASSPRDAARKAGKPLPDFE